GPVTEHRHTDPLDMYYEPPPPPGEKRRTLMLLGLIIGSVVLAAVAQLALKYGMNEVGAIGRSDLGSPVATALRVFRQPAVLGGFALFGLSAVLWLVVLSRTSLSFAYPFAGITYVLILIFDRVVLGEPVTALRWAGVLLIIGGLVLISRTAST
ncbi:MAG TPA: hypothetical protein VF058_07560, partial [Actinomycetota bacterium]